MAEINGTDASETLDGTEQDDIIRGNGGNDTLNGLGGADHLLGGEGDDVLDGGAPFTGQFEHEFRANRLEGGRGNDTYFTTGFNRNDGPRFQADLIQEAIGEGYDTVFTTRTYELAGGAEIEELRLTSASADEAFLGGNEFNNAIFGAGGPQHIFGGGGDDRLFGFAGNDKLIGGSGNDLLDGGEGVDWLDGGGDNDTYFADLLDTIVEFGGGGDDIVVVSTDYRLALGSHIETLRTSDPTGTAALSLGGNEIAQSIYGNAGDNVLRGFQGDDYLVGLAGNDTLDGGAGADNMRGGTGNDVYRVDDARDAIFENAGEGDDRVASSVDYTLAAGAAVEVLSTSTGAGGTDPISLTGNAFDQSLYGNAGGNVLRGAGGDDYLVGLAGNDTLDGGTGADNLRGGIGNDRYHIDDAGDAVYEDGGEGDDLLVAATSFTLAAGVSVETMIAADGGAPLELTGNETGQSLYGNEGVNVLDGKAGRDYLVGGLGSDLFAFTTSPADNVDAIGDFVSGVDRIGIDNAVFHGLDGGALAPGAFRTGSSAQDADDRIIYDPATGYLWFDPDGAGAAAMINFAVLVPGTNLTSSDFVVI